MLAVRAPATSANFGSGYDTFGAALGTPADVIQVEKASATTIEVTGTGSQYVPEDPEQNTAGVVAAELDAPARIQIDKGVRPASGLGSSAASAAGVAVALNDLYELGYSREELVWAAAEGEAVVSGEAHADNVAPAILGGFTVVTEGTITQIDASIPVVACLPDLVISTRDARQIVPESASVEDLVTTVGNAATLTAGMCRNEPGLVGRGMDDPVVTPARARLITGFDTVRTAALDAGATGVTVSGAGPAILAACYRHDRSAVASAMLDAFDGEGVEARAFATRIGPGVERF